jgi:hypothetical protein
MWGQLLSSPTFRRMRSPVFISRLNAVFRFINISFVSSSLIPHPRFKYLHLVPSIVLARRPSPASSILQRDVDKALLPTQ